jgi:hypothetical protein
MYFNKSSIEVKLASAYLLLYYNIITFKNLKGLHSEMLSRDNASFLCKSRPIFGSHAILAN